VVFLKEANMDLKTNAQVKLCSHYLFKLSLPELNFSSV